MGGKRGKGGGGWDTGLSGEYTRWEAPRRKKRYKAVMIAVMAAESALLGLGWGCVR